MAIKETFRCKGMPLFRVTVRPGKVYKLKETPVIFGSILLDPIDIRLKVLTPNSLAVEVDHASGRILNRGEINVKAIPSRIPGIKRTLSWVPASKTN